MIAPARPPRTQRSFQLQLAFASALWLFNFYRIATGFHAMSFMTAATAVMIFCLLPIDLGRNLTRLHTAAA